MSDSQFQFLNDDTDNIVDKIVQASTLENEGKIEEAIAVYQEIIDLDPSGNYGNVAREALSNLGISTIEEDTIIDSQSSEVEVKVGYSFWDKLNLRVKTTVILIGISAFSTISVGVIAYNFANRSALEQIKSAEQNTAEKIADKVAFYMRERFGDIQVMSNLTILTNSELRAKTKVQDKQTAMDSFIKAYTIYDSVAAFDLEGNVIAQSTGTPLSNHRNRSYFQAAITADGAILSQPLLSPDSGIMAVYLAAPIKDTATGKNIGVIRARMPVKYLRDVILSGDTEHSNYLLDKQGQILLLLMNKNSTPFKI
jgi:methyl-accepting chemotaxis protein PixJ